MPGNQVSQTPADPLEFQAALTRACQGLNLKAAPPSEATCDRLRAFCTLLLRWNASLNLTGCQTWLDLVHEHLPDAFVLAEEVPPQARIVDVGSGGGLPALPLCLLRPDLTVYMIEPRAKRVAFLRTAVRELGVSGGIPILGRDDAWTPPPDGVNVAVSRATFSPAEWVSRARKLVNKGRVFALLSAEMPAGLPVGGNFRGYELHGGHKRQLAWFDNQA